MSRERFAQIIVATIIVLGVNGAVVIFFLGEWLGLLIMSPLSIVTVAIWAVLAKKRFAQMLISVGCGYLGAALIMWLLSFSFGSHYFISWPIGGWGVGYLLAGLVMKAWERRVLVSE